MSKPWIAMTVVITLIVGISLGVGGSLLFDDDDGGGGGGTSDAPAVGCDEAQAVVDVAFDRVTEIQESEQRDPSYYAALIVEQRSIVYVMDLAPACFALQDRAGAQGLLDGLHALLASLSAAPAAPAAPVAVPDDAGSSDESSGDSSGGSSDPGD